MGSDLVSAALPICAGCGFPSDTDVALCSYCASRESAPAAAAGHLRPYQEEALAAILEALRTGRSTLAVMPTGTGKTVLFDGVIASHLEEHGGRAIVLAHRDELIQQAKAKIERFSGLECDIEKGDSYADQFGLTRRAPVLVTSVQTMSRPRRQRRFSPSDFGLLVIDEAHHATAATYRAVMDYFGQNDRLKIVGVTATPDRADERALGKVFDSVAYEYQLPQAIDDGWLVPLRQQFVRCDALDLSAVKANGKGDFTDAQLNAILREEKHCHEVAKPLLDLCGTGQTIVFTAGVDQAKMLAEILDRHRPGCSEWVCGDQIQCPQDLRRDTLRRFGQREFQFLLNCGVLTEGYDEPEVSIVAILRPTKSRALYAQMIGRGTRTIDNCIEGTASQDERRGAIASSRKPYVTVLDFVGNSGQHKLIHAADVLGGNYADDVVAAATQAATQASQRGERLDMLDALRAAETQLQEARRRQRAAVKIDVRYSTREIDPFDIYDIAPKREPGWHKGRQPTDKQRAYLEKCGVPTKNLSFHQASQLIDESFKRRTAGLCSFKQAKILKRFGLSADVTFAEASRLIDQIAANGWRPLTAKV